MSESKRVPQSLDTFWGMRMCDRCENRERSDPWGGETGRKDVKGRCEEEEEEEEEKEQNELDATSEPRKIIIPPRELEYSQVFIFLQPIQTRSRMNNSYIGPKSSFDEPRERNLRECNIHFAHQTISITTERGQISRIMDR